MNTDRPAESGAHAVRRVLLVDDDTTQLKLTRLRLQAAGFDVDTARDAGEALEALSQRRPDAVMSDVLMDDVDGFGLCRRVRQEPALDGVPVILLSAHYDGDSARDLAKHVGANELIQRSPGFDAELAALERSLGTVKMPSLAPAERATYEEHLRTNAQQLAKLLSQARRAEERYRTLLEQANDAIMITRVDGTIVEANGRWRDILGVPIEQLVGRKLDDFRSGAIAGQPGSTATIVGTCDALLGPISFTSRSGRTVLMALSRTVVEVEGESLVLLIGNDVTNMIETSRAVAAVEERYRTLVERIPDVIWTKTVGDSITFYTTNAEPMFGERIEALMSADFHQRFARVHPDDRAALDAAFEGYWEHGTTFDLEYRYRRKDGRWLWLRERSFETTARNGTRVGEGMISDVTERKRLEEELRQAQKMEALGQLTGGIAHDFNNILATILANAQFLIDALPAGDARRDDAEAIRDAGDRAANLTRQLLAFSRRQVLELRVVDLNSAVAGVQRMLRSIIRENIEFVFVPSESVGCVRIDLGQLEQVIMNLVVNACDAMPAGGRLTIETILDPSADRVRLCVQDNGMGMDEATLKHIFEPFFTTKEKGRGTGLGLATCYGIVEQSGGRISVESEPGSGTTFTITLPRVDELPTSSPRIDKVIELGGHETILLIEDDPAVRTVAKRLFQRRGYQVLTAADAAEAEAVGGDDTARIDIVVSDIILPGATGPYIVEQLRKKRPALKALYVSGYSDPPALGGAEAIAKLRILEKPFKPEKLLSAVRAELAR